MQNNVETFVSEIKNFYCTFGRSFPWRETTNPYHIVVSEIMLQQTQTHRVFNKYEQFIGEFSSFEMLAQSSLRDVLSVWQGLGYNRRAKALHDIAQLIIKNYKGVLPEDPQILETFPGIGSATAASIVAFAFNKPTVFIETNIRAVFIHFFFVNRDDVHDKEIFPFIEKTLDRVNPREWYYALMDYGVMLKKQIKNPSRKSVHHTRQSRFEGSNRQIRGAILRCVTNAGTLSTGGLKKCLAIDLKRNLDGQRVEKILTELCSEDLVRCDGSRITID